MINGARKRIYVCIYALNDKDVYAALMYCQSMGIDVRIITDSWFKLSRMKKLPSHVIISTSTMLHHKFIIVDNELLTGSANFTENGLHKNLEISIRITDKEIVGEYVDYFLKLYDFLGKSAD